MDKSSGKLTVYFDDPFWVGMFEHIDNGKPLLEHVNTNGSNVLADRGYVLNKLFDIHRKELKGYLLSEIKSDSIREKMNGLWKEKVLTLKKDEDKGDETFIKAWLRTHYAETIRETKAGAVNKDFDIIGGFFHKWVRDERDNNL